MSEVWVGVDEIKQVVQEPSFTVDRIIRDHNIPKDTQRQAAVGRGGGGSRELIRLTDLQSLLDSGALTLKDGTGERAGKPVREFMAKYEPQGLRRPASPPLREE